MKILNYTPHTINIEGVDPIETSGSARVSQTFKKEENINGIDIMKSTYGDVEGLPEIEKETMIRVSSIVAAAAYHF